MLKNNKFPSYPPPGYYEPEYPPNYYNQQHPNGAMHQYGPPPNSQSRAPIDIPKVKLPLTGVKRAALGLGAVKKMSLGKVIDGTQRTISTVNSMIPLYQQVKPFIDNTKKMTSIFKSAVVKAKPSAAAKTSRVIIEPEIVDTPIVATKAKIVAEEEKVTVSSAEETTPNKPFF